MKSYTNQKQENTYCDKGPGPCSPWVPAKSGPVRESLFCHLPILPVQFLLASSCYPFFRVCLLHLPNHLSAISVCLSIAVCPLCQWLSGFAHPSRFHLILPFATMKNTIQLIILLEYYLVYRSVFETTNSL